MMILGATFRIKVQSPFLTLRANIRLYEQKLLY